MKMQTKVMNTITANYGDITIANEVMTIAGLKNKISLPGLVGLTNAYAAGTARVINVDFSGVTIVAGDKYYVEVSMVEPTLGFSSVAQNVKRFARYAVTATTTSATDLSQAFVNAITADTNHAVSAALNGATLDLTGINAYFTFTVASHTDATVSTTTAGAISYGTPTGMSLIPGLSDLNTINSSGTYKIYVLISKDMVSKDSAVSQMDADLQYTVLFVDTTATNYGDFNAKLTSVINGDMEDEAPGTGTCSSNAVTMTTKVGVITTEAKTTAAAGVVTITVTNALIKTTSAMLVTLSNGSNTQGVPVLNTVTLSDSTAVIKFSNEHASQAFNGTFVLTYALYN